MSIGFGSYWKPSLSRKAERKLDIECEQTPMYETVILGGGPAGTGSLVWAARHGRLNAWLDRGVALVESTDALGGALGQHPLNADSRGTSFLECLGGPNRHPLLAEVKADPVTGELERYRETQPTLGLVDRFERRLGAAILKEFAHHPNSRVFTGTTALAIQRKSDHSVAVLTTTEDGQRAIVRAASAVVALGGRPNASWAAAEVAPGVDLGQWRSKIVSSHRMLTHGGADEVARRLSRAGGTPHVVIVGGAHSAFSAAWVLLERIPEVSFGPRGVQILHRTEPRPTYTSSDAALADGYDFSASDVCAATGRVHRLGGLQGDGRAVWRAIHGKPGTVRDERAVTMPLGSLARAHVIALLDGADLIIPALGYRLTTPPIFDADRRLVPLASDGPAVGPDSRLLAADGTTIPDVFGVGLGSGFTPWGPMSGEASFSGQQNSLWLYQNGLGEMIYTGTRRLALRQRALAAEPAALPA